jgi:topoisomerase-4 subunit A
VTDNYEPNVQIKHKPDGKTNEIIILPITEIVEVRGWKAIGSKLNYPKLVDASFIETDIIDPEADVDDKNKLNNPSDGDDIQAEELEISEGIENSANKPEAVIPDSKAVQMPLSIENDEIIIEKTIEVDTNKEIQEDIPLIIKNSVIPEELANEEDDIPFEIKNIAPENLPKEKGKGEQLGLF